MKSSDLDERELHLFRCGGIHKKRINGEIRQERARDFLEVSSDNKSTVIVV